MEERKGGLTYIDATKLVFKAKEILDDEQFQVFAATVMELKARGADLATILTKAKEVFNGNEELISGLNSFLPDDHKIPTDDDNKHGHTLAAPMDFVNRIRETFHDNDRTYKSFLDILGSCRGQNKTDMDRIWKQVSVLFKKQPDLLEEFSRFMNDCLDDETKVSRRHNPYEKASCQRKASNQHNPYEKASHHQHNPYGRALFDCEDDQFDDNNSAKLKQSSIDFLSRVRETFDDNGRTYESFLNMMGSCRGDNKIDMDRIWKQVSVLFKDETGLLEEFSRFMDNCCDDETKVEKDSHHHNHHTYEKASHQRKASRHRNRYERALFDCEDDQFETDMLTHRFEAAEEHAVNFLRDYGNLCGFRLFNPDIVVEEHFTILDKIAIERMYGDHGEGVMGVLSCDPVHAVRTVLPRLKQKLEELVELRREKIRTWKRVYKENHRKSLGHQASTKRRRTSYETGEEEKTEARNLEVDQKSDDGTDSTAEEEKARVRNLESEMSDDGTDSPKSSSEASQFSDWE